MEENIFFPLPSWVMQVVPENYMDKRQVNGSKDINILFDVNISHLTLKEAFIEKI